MNILLRDIRCGACKGSVNMQDCATVCNECGASVNPDTGEPYMDNGKVVKASQFGGGGFP